MDIQKFTERAQGFLQAAQTIAVREFHQRITAEHLLKALLDDPEGAAAGLIRAGARGVLPPDASETQIAAALQATAADLIVHAPESAPPTVAQGASVLTARETEVLRLIAEGLANKEIAHRLGISEHTVKFHVSALLGKLGAASRAEAIALGIRQGAIML